MLAPPAGYSTNDRRQEITVSGHSDLGTPVDIQIEWRRQRAIEFPANVWTPTPTYTVSIEDAVSDSPQVSEPPTDLAYGTWWFRARAGNSTSNVWSAWSPQNWIELRPVLGSLTQYVEMNIGVTDPPLYSALAYVEMNVGVPDAPLEPENAVTYVEMNVGVRQEVLNLAAYTDLNIGPKFDPYVVMEYTDLNVVTDETPVPHIWWIRPEQGKEGYVFNIYGQGFGAFQNEYDGKVLLGNLVCSIARWEIVPAEARVTTVSVIGSPRTTASTTALPQVLLNASSVVIEEGDIIEYDLRWEAPGGSRLDIFPTFDISGVTTEMGYASALLNDTTGDAWISDQPEAYSAWHHRRFVVPPGNYLIGRTISNFAFAWYGSDAAAPVRAASIRSMVVRDSDESVKLWVMGDDQLSRPPLNYTANGGDLQSVTFEQEGFEIIHGEGLDPDTITPEYGWIVAVVPSGAVSSMVRVVLEDD